MISMSKEIKNTIRFGWAGWSALGVWAVAAAGVVYWGLLLVAPKTWPVLGLSSPEVLKGQSTPAVTQALGGVSSAQQASVPVVAQYKLLGVIAAGSGQGSALISWDGQPPKAFRVGQVVHDGLKLVSLTPRQARLQSSGQALVLELPESRNP